MMNTRVNFANTLAAPFAVTPAHKSHVFTSADWALLLTPGLIWGASFLFIAGP